MGYYGYYGVSQKRCHLHWVLSMDKKKIHEADLFQAETLALLAHK
jgi:hypothetical protein